MLLDRRARRGEGGVEHVPHGEHHRSGVDPVSLLVDDARDSPRFGVPLVDHHLVAPPGEMARGGEPAQARADDDDAHPLPVTPGHVGGQVLERASGLLGERRVVERGE